MVFFKTKLLDSLKDKFDDRKRVLLEKPRYIKAITANNSPRYDWGPKKKINQYGFYDI